MRIAKKEWRMVTLETGDESEDRMVFNDLKIVCFAYDCTVKSDIWCFSLLRIRNVSEWWRRQIDSPIEGALLSHSSHLPTAHATHLWHSIQGIHWISFPGYFSFHTFVCLSLLWELSKNGQMYALLVNTVNIYFAKLCVLNTVTLITIYIMIGKVYMFIFKTTHLCLLWW